MSGRCARSAVALLLRYRRQCTVFLCFAAGAVAAQTAISASPPMPEFTMENPAPGIYLHYGQQAEMTAANFGDVANVGFVVGARCVAVIDTGGTFAVGRALRQAIRRVTSVPVRLPLPPAARQGSIYENQAGAAKFYFDKPAN